MSNFSEANYFNVYKEIRDRFRHFAPYPLVFSLLDILHRPAKDDLERLQRQPWAALLLIKWILVDKHIDYKPKKFATANDAVALLNAVIDLAGKARMPTDYEHYILFLRAIAYQQFPFQENFELANFARQYLLFSDLPEDHFIKTTFLDLTGLSIRDFLTLSVVLLVPFLAQEGHEISEQFFAPFIATHGHEAPRRFLDSFAKSLAEMTTYINQRNDGTRPAAEYYEQSPFFDYPLIKVHRGAYLCVDRRLLYERVEHFIYDRMRQWDAQRFMNEFGFIFERHVEAVIQHAGLPYINENQVKQVIGEKGKVIDFIVSDGEANIFVDAKAVEMAYQGKVAHLGEMVEARAGGIVKAIQQAQEAVGRLGNAKPSHPSIKSTAQNYLIVVTFKELYLGNGNTMHESVAKASIDAIYANCVGKPSIPLENIYFLNIADFEMLAEAIHEQKITFANAIERAKNDDAQPHTRKFVFRQHLIGWNIIPDKPRYLKERLDNEIEGLETLLTSQQAG